jgi:putative sterol carrier protein
MKKERKMSNQTPDLRPRTVAQAIEGMALTFNPDQAKDLSATIQFHVTGEGGGEWNLNIASDQCCCERGVALDPTLTITTPADVWLAIARKEMKGAIALMTGRYKANGKLGLLMKMDKIFSRQPTVEEIAAQGWLEE